jgi:hypothetical protein
MKAYLAACLWLATLPVMLVVAIRHPSAVERFMPARRVR